MPLLNVDAAVAVCLLVIGYLIVADDIFTRRQRRIVHWVLALLGLFFIYASLRYHTL